jgi:hypothetical protein
MMTFSRSMQRVADVVGRVFGRITAMIVGFVMTALGLGMTVTIVMLPVGVVLMIGGVLVFVAGLFAPDNRTAPTRKH